MSLLGAMDNMMSASMDGAPVIPSVDYVAYAQAVHELVHRYDLDPDMVVAISEAAAGGPQEALSMLDQGMPVEYVLAMGETR